MFIKKIGFFIFLFFYFNFLYSQNINGTVKDSNGIAIENASISVWNSEEKQTLFGYCYTNQNGDFSYKLNDKISETFIEVSCINYEKTSKKVNDITSKVIFILQNKELELEEIKIVNEKAVRVKNDSVFYDPKKFLNGTERKVEDLLKKLPGITVNESTGQIKYKGKNVETVKLEGDDLFGSNYTMGTKNISVDMVEQVQAIDNYSSNPLLKGIEETDKVVLNLKLKKGKTDYSGSATINNGYGNKVFFADDITLLGISKKIKSFGIASYNNFGIDINNFEPNSDEINSTRFSNEDFFTKKNLLESVSNTFLPASKTNFNNTFFTNFNLIYKINSKISIKNNFYYFNDKLELNESTSTKYFLANNQIIENNTENKFFRNPNYFRADTKLIYNTSKISLLQIDFSVKEQVVNSSLSTIQNFENQFNSKLKTTDFFIKLKVEYTLKLTDKTALQFNSFLSKNDIPQELVFSPSNNFITGVNAFKTIQNSNFEKQVISNRFTYLFSKGKIKSAFTFGHIYTYQPFNSKLNESDTFNSEYQNDLIYKKSNLFMEYSSVFKFRNIKIQPFVSISDYQQNLK